LAASLVIQPKSSRAKFFGRNRIFFLAEIFRNKSKESASISGGSGLFAEAGQLRFHDSGAPVQACGPETPFTTSLA
jgi:hypothetical protein